MSATKYAIGLDLGTSSVKMVQLAEEEGKKRLINARIEEYKRSSGSGETLETEKVHALKNIFRGIDIKHSAIIVNINCANAAVKTVIVPYMPRTELRDGLTLEAKNYFPFPIDEASIDFEILGDVVEKGVRKYEILVAACSSDAVNEAVAILKKVGVKPASIKVSSYSLFKLAERQREGQTLCFIDMGEFYTEVVIAGPKRLLFTRKVPIAGADFTKAMTGVLATETGKTRLSMDEGERIKREVGIPSQTEPRIIENKISTSQVLSLLRGPLEHLTGEIERSFDYYREQRSGSAKIDSIILFGGTAGLAGLTKHLSEATGMPVRLGDSLEGLNPEKDILQQGPSISYRLNMAIGAALSGPKSLNLLPGEIKEEKKRVFTRAGIEALATALVIGLVLLYAGMKIELNNITKRIVVAKLELSSMRPQLEIVDSERIARKILMDEPHWEDVFIELADLMPDTIHIVELSMDNNIITLTGIASSGNDEEALADFIQKLEKGIFNKVTLVESKELRDKKGTEFQLKCWIDYER